MKKIAVAIALAGVLSVQSPAAALAQSAALCGLHRAEVTETRDPEGRDRLRVLAPSISAQPIWAERLYAKKPLRAAAASPGDLVFVLLEGCDPARPVVIGLARPQ